MAISGQYLNNAERGTIRKKCICGKFNVRRIKNDKSVAYRVPKETSGHQYNTKSFYFRTRPASDGLCERCKRYGIPETKVLSTVGAIKRTKYERGDRADGRRKLREIEIKIGGKSGR